MCPQSDQPVPKFLTFKPKPSENQLDDRSISSKHSSRNRCHDSNLGESRHRSRRSNHDRDSHSDRESYREHKSSSSRVKRKAEDDELLLSKLSRHRKNRPESYDDHKDLYVVDTRGDRQNVIYGTCDKYKVPAYRRHGAGSILGLPPSLRIDRTLSDEQGVVLKLFGSKVSSDARPLLQKDPSRIRPRRLKQVEVGGTPDTQTDYIMVGRRLEDINLIAARQPSLNTAPDSDLDSDASDTQDAVRSRARNIKQRTETLSKTVQLNPESVQAWLDLVDHQSEVVAMEKPDGTALTGSERRSIAEVRLSILQSALSKISDNSPDVVKLVLRILHEGSVIWDFKTLSKKRANFLQKYPDNFDLWLEHINSLETDIMLFTYDECLKLYRSVLERFSQGHRRVSDSRIVYIFLRLTRMAYAAGYQEFSTALWQAILEFRFFPAVPATLESFEEFWEEEVPRIGEPGGLGWNAFSQGQGQPPDAVVDTNPSLPKCADEFERFALSEINYMERHVLPSRVLDNPDEQDPFCTVMFSDLEPYLKVLDHPLDPEFLLQAFLCYCSLPPIGCPPDELRQFWTDPFLCSQSLDPPPRNNDDSESTSGSFSSSLNKLKRFPIQFKVFDTVSLFDDAFNHIVHSPFYDWAVRVVKTLSKCQPFNNLLQEYATALDLYYNSSKSSIKFAKSLLRQNPSNLKCYNAIAIANLKAGQPAEAVRIWAAALGTSSVPGCDEDAIVLWNSWIRDCLDNADFDQAVVRVLSIGTGSVLPDKAQEADLLSFPAVDVLRSENVSL